MKSKLPKVVKKHEGTYQEQTLCSQCMCVKLYSIHTGMSYFGQNVKVLSDDGKEYIGVICRRDPQTEEWVTRFEDGTENKVADPNRDKDYTLL